MFCLAKNLFEGVSKTFFISIFFPDTFTNFPLSITVFLLPPLVLKDFLLFSPSFTILPCPGFSYDFLFLLFVYFPPVIFLPSFMIKV